MLFERVSFSGHEVGQFENQDEALKFASKRLNFNLNGLVEDKLKKVKTNVWDKVSKDYSQYALAGTRREIRKCIWEQKAFEIGDNIYVVVGRVPFSEKFGCWGIDKYGTIFSILKMKKKIRLAPNIEAGEPYSAKNPIIFESFQSALIYVKKHFKADSRPDSIQELTEEKYVFPHEKSDLDNPKVNHVRKSVHKRYIEERRIFLANIGQEKLKFFIGKFRSGFGCWIFENGVPKILGVRSEKEEIRLSFKDQPTPSTTRRFEGLYKAHGVEI